MVAKKNPHIDGVVDYDALNLWDEGIPLTKTFYDLAKGAHYKPEKRDAGIFQVAINDLEMAIIEAINEPTFQNGITLAMTMRDYNSIDSFHARILQILDKEMKFVGEKYSYMRGVQVTQEEITAQALGFIYGIYEVVAKQYVAPEGSSLEAIFDHGFKMVRSVMLLCTANNYEIFKKLIEDSVVTFHKIQGDDIFSDESPVDSANNFFDRIDFEEGN